MPVKNTWGEGARECSWPIPEGGAGASWTEDLAEGRGPRLAGCALGYVGTECARARGSFSSQESQHQSTCTDDRRQTSARRVRDAGQRQATPPTHCYAATLLHCNTATASAPLTMTRRVVGWFLMWSGGQPQSASQPHTSTASAPPIVTSLRLGTRAKAPWYDAV